MTCDPCQFCQHCYDDSDYSVGYCGYGCTFYEDHEGDDDEWEPGCGRKCPGFFPVLASDSLLEQLWNEEQARQYLEDEKALREAYEEDE